MHDHIKKLLDRFYATKDSNMRFSPTNLVTSEAQTLYDILFAVLYNKFFFSFFLISNETFY